MKFKMSLQERGLWLQCEAMKLEIANLQAENESLLALVNRSTPLAQLPEKPASLEALHEGFLDYLDSKIPDFIKKIRDEKGEETPLAKLPEKRE